MASRKPAPYKPVDSIRISIWGKYAGAVALDPRSGFYAFQFEPRFLSSGIELAPLQMPLSTGGTPLVFATLPEATYRRLPAFLADVLPDDFGNALVNRYMAERGYSASQVTPLDRLAYAGKRSMGALEFEPTRSPRTTSSVIEMSKLVQEARATVMGQFGDDAETNAALRSIIDVGTSANGARAKAVIGWDSLSGAIRSGHTSLPTGFEHWLLKFDGMGGDNELGSSRDFGRIEYAYYKMADAAGVKMNPCRLLQEGGRAHFMTKRFDRDAAGNKIHMQSFCAMAHVDFKLKGVNGYAQLFQTILELSLPRESLLQAYRRMVFNVLGRNCDDHTKNFSFLLRNGSNWELAPAYDVTFAHNPAGEWTKHHLMSVNGKFEGFSRQDLLDQADRFAIGEAKEIIEEVGEATDKWREFAAEAEVAEEQVAHIESLHIKL